MSKIAIIALKAVGGAALFGVSYVGFAKVNGVPLNSLPGIGRMFPEHVEPEAPAEHAPIAVTNDAQATEAQTTPPAAATHESSSAPKEPSRASPAPEFARASVLDLLDADSLYTQDE